MSVQSVIQNSKSPRAMKSWLRTRVLLAAFTALALMCSSALVADDNADLEAGIAALIGTHNFALPFSFFPDPFIGIPAGLVTYGTNLGLKDTRAVFVTPNGWNDWPNTADECHFQFSLPQSSAEYSNL